MSSPDLNSPFLVSGWGLQLKATLATTNITLPDLWPNLWLLSCNVGNVEAKFWKWRGMNGIKKTIFLIIALLSICDLLKIIGKWLQLRIQLPISSSVALIHGPDKQIIYADIKITLFHSLSHPCLSPHLSSFSLPTLHLPPHALLPPSAAVIYRAHSSKPRLVCGCGQCWPVWRRPMEGEYVTGAFPIWCRNW